MFNHFVKSISWMAVMFAFSTSFGSDKTKFSYECSEPKMPYALDAGGGNFIYRIKSLKIATADAIEKMKVNIVVNGLTAEQRANGLKPTDSTEVFSLRQQGTEGLFALSPYKNNRYLFDATFLEFGSIDVASAGPLPPGIYDMKISLAFVDANTYYKKTSPMTVVKVPMACKVSISY